MLPSAIAITAITAINGCYGIYGNSHGTANMATMGIQGKSIEKLTQLCWFELNRTIPSKDCLKSSCWSLECSLYYKTGRLGVKFTDTRNTWPRRKTKGVLDSDKVGEHFGRV